jgi:hypothetical protein
MTKRIGMTLLLFYSVNFLKAQPESTVVVTDVKISFLVPARSEDKDMTTQISATLYTAAGKRVAMLDKCCGNIHYPDANFTSSTYELDMRNTISKTEMQSGYFDVHIDPSGNDRWIFVPTLQISFSDGTKVTIKGPDDSTPYTRREVSQQAPDSSFPFHL